MKVIIKKVGQEAVEEDIGGFGDIYNLIGSFICTIVKEDIVMLSSMSAEDKNFTLYEQDINGDVIFAGNTFSNLRSLTEKEKNQVTKILGKKTLKKQTNGENGLVILTKDEYKKLCDRFGEERTKTYIEKLDNYIGRTGKKYKSHYLTIISFIRSDEEKGIYIFGSGREIKKNKFYNFEQKETIEYDEIKRRAIEKLMKGRIKKND